LKLDDFIYCVAGDVDESWKNSTNKVLRLNLNDLHSGWQEVASMAKERSHFGAAICNGSLVVAGGSNKGAKLNTTELYQSSLMKKWISFEPLYEKKRTLFSCNS